MRSLKNGFKTNKKLQQLSAFSLPLINERGGGDSQQKEAYSPKY